jgi:alpha/beta hydrolase fold
MGSSAYCALNCLWRLSECLDERTPHPLAISETVLPGNLLGGEAHQETRRRLFNLARETRHFRHLAELQRALCGDERRTQYDYLILSDETQLEKNMKVMAIGTLKPQVNFQLGADNHMDTKPSFIEHYVPREQGRVYVRDYAGTGPAFVLMHGFPDNLHIYDELIPHLVAAGRWVVTFDFLGFGASDKPAGANYGFKQQQNDLEASLTIHI